MENSVDSFVLLFDFFPFFLLSLNMANVTDPLIRVVQGSDPQNLMEYITRQKIYDSRFWKEECFGLSVVNVLEKAAKSLTCIGGTMGANQQPTRFLCLTLKLLQLQPESETIQDEFIKQDHFKYVRALGAFYLRLTGRPANIYESLEPLYQDYSKLKLRERNEWRLIYMDQVVHELFTENYFCGITLPRLPARETLQQEGYLEEGSRSTALNDVILNAGGLEHYLKYKAHVEKSPAALELWKERMGESSSSSSKIETKTAKSALNPSESEPRDVPLDPSKQEVEEGQMESSEHRPSKRKQQPEDNEEIDSSKKKKKTKKEKGYGTLFKSSKRQDKDRIEMSDIQSTSKVPPAEGSEEYWNEQRAKLGLKPLNKS